MAINMNLIQTDMKIVNSFSRFQIGYLIYNKIKLIKGWTVWQLKSYLCTLVDDKN